MLSSQDLNFGNVTMQYATLITLKIKLKQKNDMKGLNMLSIKSKAEITRLHFINIVFCSYPWPVVVIIGITISSPCSLLPLILVLSII